MTKTRTVLASHTVWPMLSMDCAKVATLSGWAALRLVDTDQPVGLAEALKKDHTRRPPNRALQEA